MTERRARVPVREPALAVEPHEMRGKLSRHVRITEATGNATSVNPRRRRHEEDGRGGFGKTSHGASAAVPGVPVMHGYTHTHTHVHSSEAIQKIMKILFSFWFARRRARPRRTDRLGLIRNSHPVRPAGNLARFYERPKNPINIILTAECTANRSRLPLKALPRQRVAGSSKDVLLSHRRALPCLPRARAVDRVEANSVGLSTHISPVN